MRSSTRRRVLGALSGAGVAGVAGCFGSDDDPNGDERGESRNETDDDANEEDNENGDTEGSDDESSDDQPDERKPPEPVDWTDESRATIEVGPDENVFDPDSVRIETRTTLRWVWMSEGHTISPTDQPTGDFAGVDSPQNAGHEFEFVPETPGEYRYVCEEHEEMVGYLVVE